MKPAILVEPRTLKRMNSVSENMSKKTNGENIVRIILIALGPEYYSMFQSLSTLIFFKIFLFLWTLTIFYHLYNGIRYLFWSYGKMMELSTVYKSGYVVIILSILGASLTASTPNVK